MKLKHFDWIQVDTVVSNQLFDSYDIFVGSFRGQQRVLVATQRRSLGQTSGHCFIIGGSCWLLRRWGELDMIYFMLFPSISIIYRVFMALVTMIMMILLGWLSLSLFNLHLYQVFGKYLHPTRATRRTTRRLASGHWELPFRSWTREPKKQIFFFGTREFRGFLSVI